jgi:general secretion pathway protein G
MSRGNTNQNARISRAPSGRAGRGITLVEVITAMLVLAVLALMAMPLGKNALQRRKEWELRRALSVMRNAIDRYHEFAVVGRIQPWDPDWEFYPPDLETLVEGVEVAGTQGGEPRVERFLREIPEDPMTGERAWGLRSYQMDPDETSWDGANLYDVYSLAPGIGLNEMPYSEW